MKEKYFHKINQLLLLAVIFVNCNNSPIAIEQTQQNNELVQKEILPQNKIPVIHVFVALCDNVHQGIVPVPKVIGNGQDPANNLYWGCDYGVKTFFKNKTKWKLVQTIKNPATNVLERCIFKHTIFNSYMVADAYDGAYIKTCTQNFFNACAGAKSEKIIFDKDTFGIAGNAQLVAYIGHDGLMDFTLDSFPKSRDHVQRACIILACMSKQYFGRAVYETGAKPLLWTTQLMCPEAYTLDAAVTGWLNKETDAEIHSRASTAYSKYQNCSVSAAGKLLVTGF